jgi:hypothetical protein
MKSSLSLPVTLRSVLRRLPIALLLLVGLVTAAVGAVISFVGPRDSGVPPRAVGRPPGFSLGDTESSTAAGIARVLAVGDIGDCTTNADDAVAEAMAEREGTILALGDIVYPDGSAEHFEGCFAPSWGALVPRIRPVPGNHDYETEDASAYFAFFGPAAGDPRRGYYSFDLGDWHLVALNSACDEPDIGCTEGSPQLEWLVQDLSQSSARCTLAYWHAPRFSSGKHGGDATVQPFWEILHRFGADVILNGHDHNYERFAPMGPDGQRDDATGMRQFVVGTGGSDLRPMGEIQPNNELWATGYPGFLQISLDDHGYEWAFLSTTGEVVDTGSDTCH